LLGTYKEAHKKLSHSNLIQLQDFSHHLNKLPSYPHHWHNGSVVQSTVTSKIYCTHQNSLKILKTPNIWFNIVCVTMHM